MQDAPDARRDAAADEQALLVRQLRQLIDYRTPLVVRGLAEAGVFQALAAGPLPLRALAAARHLHTGALERALRLVEASGLVELVPADSAASGTEDTVTLGPIGRLLLEDHPANLAGTAVFLPWEIASWSRFDHSLATGEPAADVVFGRPVFDELAARPAWMDRFAAFMAARTDDVVPPSIAAFDGWPEAGTVVDVGGGDGALLRALVAQRPDLHAVLVDLPDVCEVAARSLAARPPAAPVELVPADMFTDPLPAGDCYVLKNILHDWDDERCGTVLDGVARAARPGARLALLEGVLQPPGRPDPLRGLDLHMLVLTGGRERTAEEWTVLLERHGYGPVRFVPAAVGHAWIDAPVPLATA